MIQSNVEWRSPPPHFIFLIFILYWNNDHIITDTDRQKQIMWNIKVSKRGNDRIRFISELRNKQVNLNLFRKIWIKKILTDYVIEARYEVNPRSMVKNESPT